MSGADYCEGSYRETIPVFEATRVQRCDVCRRVVKLYDVGSISLRFMAHYPDYRNRGMEWDRPRWALLRGVALDPEQERALVVEVS